jgi:fructose-1,6-bisphosphatase/sedoheptulose 1,7-bisphosphatase-like protein
VDATAAENVLAVARSLKRPPEEVVVCILDRDRNAGIIDEVRQVGARIRLIGDGDVHGAVATCIEGTGIHLYLGIGAAPEGVLACAAIKSLGGQFMGRFRFRDDADRERAAGMARCDIDGVLDMDCLVNTDEAAFLATGITDGEMLRGVRYFGSGSRTHSLAIDGASRTVRFVESVYRENTSNVRIRLS